MRMKGFMPAVSDLCANLERLLRKKARTTVYSEINGPQMLLNQFQLMIDQSTSSNDQVTYYLNKKRIENVIKKLQEAHLLY